MDRDGINPSPVNEPEKKSGAGQELTGTYTSVLEVQPRIWHLPVRFPQIFPFIHLFDVYIKGTVLSSRWILLSTYMSVSWTARFYYGNRRILHRAENLTQWRQAASVFRAIP